MSSGLICVGLASFPDFDRLKEKFSALIDLVVARERLVCLREALLHEQDVRAYLHQSDNLLVHLGQFVLFDLRVDVRQIVKFGLLLCDGLV